MGVGPFGVGTLGAKMPDGQDALWRAIRDLERSAREQAAANTLQAAQFGKGGILVTDNGAITFSGTGALNTNGALTTSGSFNAATSITAGTVLNAQTLSIIAGATIGGSISGASLNVGSGAIAGGPLSGSTCSLTSDLTAANVRLGSSGTVYSLYALSNPVVTAYVAAYINGPDGRFGATPSARRFKQNIRRKQYTVEDAKRLSKLVVNYRLKEAVKQYGDHAPIEVGVIAEELIKAGFPEFVIHDAKGRTLSVAYERIWLVIGSAFGELTAAVEDIESRLKAAGI